MNFSSPFLNFLSPLFILHKKKRFFRCTLQTSNELRTSETLNVRIEEISSDDEETIVKNVLPMNDDDEVGVVDMNEFNMMIEYI